MDLMDPTNSLFRTYIDNESVIAEEENISTASSRNVADLRDFDDGGSPNWSPRSTKCSTCDTRISKSQFTRTVITIPRSSFKNNETITVKKTLVIPPDDFKKHQDPEPDNGVLRRQFETQNARVRDLTQQLRQTEQKLKRETGDLQRNFKQAVNALRVAAEHENNIMQRLAHRECQLAEAETGRKIVEEKNSALEKELHKSNAKLQQMLSAIDRLEIENRELVGRENEIKTHSELQLVAWKEKCSSLELQLIELGRTARNDVFQLRMTMEANADECRSKLEQSRLKNESSLKEAKAKIHEMRHRLAEVTKENIGLRESLVRNEEQQKETLTRVKFKVDTSARRAENLQAALATHAAERDKEQLVTKLELERLHLEVRRRKSESVELEKKLRQAELISEQRLAATCQERDQIRSENSRLKLQLETGKVEAAVRRERANKTSVASPDTFAAQQLLAKANAEKEELRQRLAAVADQHQHQVDELLSTNKGLVDKIFEFKNLCAQLEKSDSLVAVRSKRQEFHLQTHHDYHDAAFCAYKKQK